MLYPTELQAHTNKNALFRLFALASVPKVNHICNRTRANMEGQRHMGKLSDGGAKNKPNPSGWNPWIAERELAGGGMAFVLCWKERLKTGKWKLRRKQFSDRTELDAWQAATKSRRDKEATLAKRAEKRGDALGWWVRLEPQDRAALMRATELMREKGGRVDGMVEAVRQYAQTHLTGAKKTVAELVEEHLQHIARTKRESTVKDRRFRLSSFVELCGESLVASITPPAIEDWALDGGGCKAHRRRAASALFSFAVRRGYLEANPVSRVEKIAASSPDSVEVFTAGQMEAILMAAQAVEPKMVPFFAIGGFAGLRPQNEIRNLDFANINLAEGGKIKVVRSTAKTKRTRYAPISDNLRQWLMAVPEAERTGKVFYSRRAFRRVVDAARIDDSGAAVRPVLDGGKVAYPEGVKLAAVTWSNDVLRHSFCTYRQAIIQNIHQLCEEAGNTPSVARAHYLEPKENAVEEAQKFFGILPGGTDNTKTKEARA